MRNEKTKSELCDSLFELLSRYAQKWPEEKSKVDSFIEFVVSGEALQGKENTKRHITASAWVLDANKSKVLLTHHAKLGIWVQLGGHTDIGEDWRAAAYREALEESGLTRIMPKSRELFDIDIHDIPEHKTAPAHRHYDLRFLFEADCNEDLELSDESHALAWVELINLETYTLEPSQLRMRVKS